ncbi:hypothetical protein KC19_8G080300, partial [Ceratodon purpureus]
ESLPALEILQKPLGKLPRAQRTEHSKSILPIPVNRNGISSVSIMNKLQCSGPQFNGHNYGISTTSVLQYTTICEILWDDAVKHIELHTKNKVVRSTRFISESCRL